jgi:hypothetical protein
MWKIGPTFASELAAAGVSLDGYSWNIFDGTFTYNHDVPVATRDAVAAVYAAHDPEAQTDPPTVPYPPGVPMQKPAQQLPGPK